jgi:hypothetical protein
MLGPRLQVIGTAATPTSQAWPANNDAYLIPFLVSTPVTFSRIFFGAGTSPGTANYDLGIYNDAFGLIRSLGATASVNTTDALLPVGGGAFTTPVTLTRGRYFVAMSAAATSITVRGAATGVTANQVLRAVGMFKMASAHPLPSTFVPASMGTTAFIPTVGLMTTASTIL